MSPSQPPHPGFDAREPISGYFTRELIGRGGFGEVWRAEAPGGLEKAIKIVHAGIDSKRAEQELRALQRIKDVRHPLTLSIERIEIIDGTLVIVTELADCSLKDVYAKNRAKGLPGIPRDELLAFMRDAADALDYIYEEHSLQHLDIKPENLLVVGNRLKLGDFGLLKNIYERGASLVSGLTPTYAPPELFEGRPTRQSDQYSLAIVYQHMLTGELPFDGATSAQLAREHLTGVPRLTALSRSERPAVARALSKVPSERFDNCDALISSLVSASPDPPSDELPDAPASLRTETVSVPVPRPGNPQSNGEPEFDDESPDRANAETPDAVLGAIEASLQPTHRASDSTARRSDAMPGEGFVPTVFIGVGGTGGHVLQELRRRISDAFGGLKEVPALQMVLLDTDGKQINSLMRDKDDWEDLDVVALPLRRPQDYRFRESELSKWLHRRWLYNMSKSLLTEGCRPLGRLAFVDHGDRALVSIRSALTKAGLAESVAKTAATSGLPFQQGHVRVVIVASISGGTGSGIVLDLAYAVRGELKSRGCSDEDVLGFLMHSTPSAPAERDKALANTYATLSELGHYSSPGHYFPGEKAVKAPSFHGDNRTFSAAYLVNLGDQIDAPGWHAGAARAAEYLFCTTATPAKPVVDAARHADDGLAQSTNSTVLLRSLDILRLDPANSDQVAACIEQACRDAVAIWESGGNPAQVVPPLAPSDSAALIDLTVTPVEVDVVPVDSGTPPWLDDCGLELNALHQTASRILEDIWDCPEQDYLRRIFQKLCGGGNDRNIPRRELVDAASRLMDRVLGDSAEMVEDDSEQASLCDRIRDSFDKHAAEFGPGIVARIASRVDDPDAGMKAARSAADATMKRLKDLRGALDQQTGGSRSEEALGTSQNSVETDRSWLGLFRRRSAERQPALMDEMLANAAHRLDQTKLAALQQYLGLIEAQISVLSDQLNQLSRDLNRLSAEFQSSASLDNAAADREQGLGPAAQEYTRRIHDALKRDRESIARSVSGELLRTVLKGEKKLQRFLGMHSQLQSTLVTPLRNVARQVVLAYVRQTTQRMIEACAQRPRAGRESACARLVSEFVDEQCRDARERLVILAPDSVDPQHLQSAFASCTSATLVPARMNGITICREGGPRPLEDVADEIIQQQDLYRQLAEKLHTREDVKWSPLALPGIAGGKPPVDANPVPAT